MIIANVFPDDTDDSSDDRLETSIMGLIVESTSYANMRFRVSAYHHVHMKSERICDKNWEKKESLPTEGDSGEYQAAEQGDRCLTSARGLDPQEIRAFTL